MAVSSGEAAGLAVGCLIAGVLMCSLVLYFLCHRRDGLRKKLGRSLGGSLEESFIGENRRTILVEREASAARGEASEEERPHSSLSTPTIGTIESIDHEVREEFHCLNVVIKSHAELYYHNNNLRPIDEPGQHAKDSRDANMATVSHLLGPHAPVDAKKMDSLLYESATRYGAIRLLLAWVLFRFMQSDAPIESTLLPPEFVKCAQVISRSEDSAAARKESEGASRQPSPSGSNPVPEVKKRISDVMPPDNEDERMSCAAKLLEPIYGSGKVKVDDARLKNIEQLVTTLDCLLQPFVAKEYGGARVRDLDYLVKAAAGFGYKLFTQRTEWEFAWSTFMADELVVCPALVKVGDDRGHKLRQSFVLTWEETVKLGESVLEAEQKGGWDMRTIAEAMTE